MIYFVRDEATLLVKIGFTNREVHGRVAEFQTGCPGLLTVMLQMSGTRQDERAWVLQELQEMDNSGVSGCSAEELQYLRVLQCEEERESKNGGTQLGTLPAVAVDCLCRTNG